MMLNAAIMILFTAICVFQPWVAVTLFFFYLLDRKATKERSTQGADLVAKLDEIFADNIEKENIPVKRKPKLRVVK